MSLTDSNNAFVSHEESNGTVLRRTLGYRDALCVTISIMIGSGIFSSPGIALERCGSPGVVLFIWSAACLLVICGALCYAELGTMFPTAGGDYEYISRAYGKGAAFSFAWYYFWICKPGAQAIIATVFGEYFMIVIVGRDFTDLSESYSWAKIVAVILIVTLTCINCIGIKETSALNNVLTFSKVVLIIVVFICGVVYAIRDSSVLEFNLSPSESFKGMKPQGLGTALTACLWAFDGWADLVFLQEELRNPTDLPKVIVSGILIVSVCYVMANIAYFCVLTKDEIVASSTIGLDFGYVVQGAAVAGIFALGVSISTMGSANSSILTGGRAFFSVSRAGQAPRFLSKLNKAGSPYCALIAQAIWTIVLLLLPGSSFSSLLNYFGPASWLFYATTSSATIALRKQLPNVDRPFRVPMYPIPPVLVILTSFYIIANSIEEDPLFCTLALCFVSLSVPVWWLVSSYGHLLKPKSQLVNSAMPYIQYSVIHVQLDFAVENET